MCKIMTTVLRREHSDSLKAPDASSLKRAARQALSSWRSETLPDGSGCDSSDCAYCQALARLRQPGGESAPAGCWLRRKRSRTDLASMAEAAPSSSGDGEQDGAALARVPSGSLAAADVAPAGQLAGSMWDHALFVDAPSARNGLPAQAAAAPEAGQTAAAAAGSEQAAAQQDAPAGTGAAAGVCPPPAPATAVEAGEPLVRHRRRSSSSSGAGLAFITEDSSSGEDGVATSGGRLGGGGGGGGGAWSPAWHAPSTLHEVAAFVPPGPYRQRQDIVCALEFEEHGWLLATAGVSKQVRVYSLASALQHPEDAAFREPIRCQRMASKLSSLGWNPDAPGAVTVADYDGVVSQVDMETGHLIAEADEHCGRRVWSVSHSLQRPHLCASASDDGTVRLWGGAGMHARVAALRPAQGAPATGVHLSPFDGNQVAVACADHSAYVYDLRAAGRPLLQLSGHARAVSYVRWLSPSRLVTASTDASLAVWQLPGSRADEQPAAAAATHGVLRAPWKRLRGHRNSKNFVGLSVRPEDGLVACGSEAAACFAYHDSWASPLAAHTFGELRLPPGLDAPLPAAAPGGEQYCSAVCWQPATARLGAAPMLAAAMSSGELRMLELQRRPGSAAARRCMDG